MKVVLGARVKHEEALREASHGLAEPYEFRPLDEASARDLGKRLRMRLGPPGGPGARAIADTLLREETERGERRGALRTARRRRRLWSWVEALWRQIEEADAVAVWNGHNLPIVVAVRMAARAQGKPVVFVEWGLMPETLQVDAEGINNGSSVARLTPTDVEGSNLPSLALKAIDGHEFRQRPLGVFDDGSLAEGLLPLPELPRDFVLYAAQVHDDTQLRLYSPDFPSLEAAIRYAAAECEAAGLPLVVKEHPQDDGYLTHGPLAQELPSVTILRHVDNDALIAACRAFVTINSSMALQAVRAEKPVFALGDAVYNLPGVVRRVRPPERLADLLRAPEASVDRSLRRRYLAYLLNVALVPFRVGRPTEAQIRGLAARIRDVAFGPSKPA